MRLSLPLSLAGLAAVITFALAGSAFAHENVRPDRPVSVNALRSLVDHYRSTTWIYQRAARVPATPTSYSYRHATDASYLQWTIDTWTRRADVARAQALARIRRSIRIALPQAPRLHSRLYARLQYSRRATIALRHVYPGSVPRGFARGHGRTAAATLHLWQKRLALTALQVVRHGWAHPPVPAISAFLVNAFTCIHRYEGAWNANTGNGYYGGLQMDVPFQSRYGSDFLRRWGTADGWPAWAQIQAAVRAYESGRGFGPWPNTARACGLL